MQKNIYIYIFLLKYDALHLKIRSNAMAQNMNLTRSAVHCWLSQDVCAAVRNYLSKGLQSLSLWET